MSIATNFVCSSGRPSGAVLFLLLPLLISHTIVAFHFIVQLWTRKCNEPEWVGSDWKGILGKVAHSRLYLRKKSRSEHWFWLKYFSRVFHCSRAQSGVKIDLKKSVLFFFLCICPPLLFALTPLWRRSLSQV